MPVADVVSRNIMIHG